MVSNIYDVEPQNTSLFCGRTEEKLLTKCVKKSVLFGRGSIMVWGLFSAAGMEPLVCINSKVDAIVF